MSKEASKKEINEFIKILKKAESVSITHQAPVPDMDEFFNLEKKDTLIHFRAYVEFSVR